MINYDYQVIIVGTGSVGSICAYKLAALGMPVLIIEKEKMPREKLCGGVLSIKPERIST